MNRLMEKTVFCGLVTACRFATVPTSRSPSFVKPTTDGVVRPPSAFGMTTGSPPSMTATTEFVVPRSMPMTLSAIAPLSIEWLRRGRVAAADKQVIGNFGTRGVRQFGRFWAWRRVGSGDGLAHLERKCHPGSVGRRPTISTRPAHWFAALLVARYLGGCITEPIL